MANPLQKLFTIAGAAALIYYFLEKSKQKLAEQPVPTEEPEVVIDVEAKEEN